MPLFVARHRHPPQTCPAAPLWASLLLAHVSAATAARHGVAIQAEALLDDAHELLLIVEAADRAHVERFMGVFARWGSVQVLPACSAEAAVARGGCGTAPAAAPGPASVGAAPDEKG